MTNFDNTATSMGPCSQAAGITVYSDASYGGTSKTYAFPTSCSNSILNDGLNDAVSSIQVSGGCVRLWTDINCAGTYMEYSANGASMTNFDNTATSMGPCATASGVVVYDTANYAGTTKTYALQTTCSNNILNDGLNDAVSSIAVSGGCVRLWGDINCAGTFRDFVLPASSLPDFDNTATSMGPCSSPPTISLTVYSDPNNAGTSKSYTVGSSCNSDFVTSNFNDMVSSLAVSGGCVRLWSDISCGGTSKDYTANAATMPDFDNSASSFGPCT